MHSIVQALGGDLYAGGRRALIPGPGHTRHDRSVSLLLTESGKIRIHAFSDHDWREIMDWLKAERLVSDDHRLIDGTQAVSPSSPVPTDLDKRAAAIGLWGRGQPIMGTLSIRWLTQWRKVSRTLESAAFRHCADAPLSAYNKHSRHRRPAFLACVTDENGQQTGTEITYLDPLGQKDTRLAIPRKLIGGKPPGAAVHIDAPDTEMLVAEGIPSALSASQFFSLPCHALLGVKSFPSWRPPKGVRRIVIAAEPGKAGETFSARLLAALTADGYICRREFPPQGHSDFNAYYGGYG